MISTTRQPLAGGNVLRFVPKSNYADSFGYEWTRYSRTYSDETIGANVSRSRLELVLGFPLDFLEGKTILEVGCGAGRFTEHLVRNAKQVIAADLSEAVHSNAALGALNLLAIQADLYDLPSFSEPIDVIFCRGVIQHTPDPSASIRALFDQVKPGGLIIFDVYRRTGSEWRNFKYFWRKIVQRVTTIENFDSFINRHGSLLYRIHHAVHHLANVWRPLRRMIAKTPLYWHMNYDNQYPQMSVAQRVQVFKNELIDMFFAHYDQPMTAEEVLGTLGSIGQRPYSYDLERNIFRCKKSANMEPLSLGFTKNGIVER